MLLLLVLAAVTSPTLARANLPHPYGNYLFPETAFPGSLIEEEASDPTPLVLAAPEQEAPVPWPKSSSQPGTQQTDEDALHTAPKIPVQAAPSAMAHEKGRAPPQRQPSITEVVVPPRPFPESEPGPALPQRPLAGMKPGPAPPQRPLAGMGAGPALPQRPLAGMGPGPALPQRPLAGSGPGPAIPPPRFPMGPGPAMSPQSFPGPQGGQVIRSPVQMGNGAPRPMNPVPLRPPPTMQGMGPGPARPAPFSPGLQFRPAPSMIPGRGMWFNFN